MITVRQLERLWQEKAFARMSALLLEMRPETSLRLAQELARSTPVAALAIIRLDELSQSYTPFCGRMLRTILAAQEADGGWGDGLTTALCIRALSCSGGDGQAITRGLEYLANLQREDGSWPRVPIRRLPGDAFTTAVVLFYLSNNPNFRETVHFGEAVAWLSEQEHGHDIETTRLCRRLHLRMPQRASAEPSLNWS
jgi:hypothetical protein